METVFPADYVLHLSTGEKVTVAEFDPERIELMRSPEVLAAADDVLRRCTRVPREVLEEAKRGHDARLKPLLRTPPVGALLKLALPVCAERKLCSMYSASGCTTRNVTARGGAFPECWEQQSDPAAKLREDVESKSRGLCTAVVHAWRQGMIAVVVEP